MNTKRLPSRFIVSTVVVCLGLIFWMAQSFGRPATEEIHYTTSSVAAQGEPKPKNLKVLPKTLTGDEVDKIMRTYTRSLGVRCGYCHAAKEVKAGEKPEMDFASDAKPEKLNARKMIAMTNDINSKYLAKLRGLDFNKISCATCHMGNVKPLVSLDSLPKKPRGTIQ